MRNYWYVSLTNRYPKPNADDPVRVVQSVQIKKKYSIVEMTREATPKEIDKYNLRYCGQVSRIYRIGLGNMQSD